MFLAFFISLKNRHSEKEKTKNTVDPKLIPLNPCLSPGIPEAAAVFEWPTRAPPLRFRFLPGQ